MMNTKMLMTSSSLVLGLAGIFALFAPDALLALVVYSIFASLFYWLIFRHTGIEGQRP